MGEAAAATGPDLAQGIARDSLPDRAMIAGRVGDEAVLLFRSAADITAVSGTCTHYGAALADGLLDGETVRCPLHHACFSLRTGAALRAPAFEPLDRWRVEIEGERIFVREKLEASAAEPGPGAETEVRAIVIIGGGAAGFACADRLRRLGYDGRLTMLSAERDPPLDRPNLSKDYLAGTAPEEWISLRDAQFYLDRKIDLRLGAEVVAIDTAARMLRTRSNDPVAFDRLLIATGSEPARPRLPGFELDNVHMLRSLSDARSIIDRAGSGSRAAVVGSSFIGMEVAAALRNRGVAVDVISLDTHPFERILGTEVGDFFRALHERNGVTFHLGQSIRDFDGRVVTLNNGRAIKADFVIAGTGVRPRTELAEAAGIAVDNGVLVNELLETSVPRIYAAGDIASYPGPMSGDRLRIEHWVTAEQQGQAAAANMLGLCQPFAKTPFFWSEQYGTAVRYVGHAARWDEVRIDGSIADGAFTARYFDEGRFVASASVGRDRASLEDELLLENAVAGASGTSPEI